MATKRASYSIAEFKAVGDQPGQFTAVVSVFGNVDLVGDRVMPGAFKNSLARWKQSGDPVPVIWSHSWDDPFAHIGYVKSALETAAGLQITGQLDLDKPFAKQVYDLLVDRRVKEFSFAYDVLNEQRAKDGANNLTELGLIEVGPTLKGANPETQLIAAKALDEAAAKQREMETTELKSVSGRKVYIDAELPGSFDEMRETVSDAVTGLLNPSQDPETYVWVQAMFPTYALVEVCNEGEDDQTYRVPWTTDGEDGVTLGTPEAVDITVTVSPKSAKAGRRLSQATQTELKTIHDAYGKAHDMLGAFLAESTTDGKQLPTGERQQTETDEKDLDDREPPAKSIDLSLLLLRTRIEEVCATTRRA